MQIKNNSDEEGMEGLPTCVKSIIGSTHLFEIHVKDYDFKSTYKSFTVSEILNQSKINTIYIIGRFNITKHINNCFLCFRQVQKRSIIIVNGKQASKTRTMIKERNQESEAEFKI